MTHSVRTKILSAVFAASTGMLLVTILATRQGFLAGTLTPLQCGNGSRISTEQCDDGDRDNGDGCDSLCTKEAGWTCNTPLYLRSTCLETVCTDADSNSKYKKNTTNVTTITGTVGSTDGCENQNATTGVYTAASSCGATTACGVKEFICNGKEAQAVHPKCANGCLNGECTCGNGVRNTNEGCDDGNDVDSRSRPLLHSRSGR